MRPRRVAIVASFIALASACGLAHEPTDAAPASDAAWSADAALHDGPTAQPDAAAPDAPICLDADGDGWSDARCGGEDCDDTDPLITPDTTRCTSPTRTESCVGGSLVVTDCDAATPYCDARTGACVSDACGDGVVHPGEACDDGAPSMLICDEQCRLNCDFSSMCPAGQFCIEPVGTFGHCAPALPGGLAMGERCTSSDECLSAWCDPDQGRCNAACLGSSSPRCTTAETLCEIDHAHDYRWTPGAPPPADAFWSCEYPCARDLDCTEISACALRVLYGPEGAFLQSTCLPRWGTGLMGSAPIGSTCDAVIGCDSNTCVDGLCTRMCLDDTDCAAPLSHCLDHDFSAMFFGGMQIARVCGS